MTPATDPDLIDIPVSDLDSDMEPDQLVASYIKIKGRLFEIDPEAVEIKPRKQGKGGKGRAVKPSNETQSPAVRKLLSQLQQLESDALFDDIEAGLQWPAKRAEIAQRKAKERLELPTNTAVPKPSGAENVTIAPRKTPTWKKPVQDARLEENNDDEDVLLGDMFSAVPNEAPRSDETKTSHSNEGITLRDFGKQSGISPRRVLEEAIRARLAYAIYPRIRC